MSESAVSAKRGWFIVWRETGAARNAPVRAAAKRRRPEEHAVEERRGASAALAFAFFCKLLFLCGI